MKKPKPLPSQEELLALFRYEPETGKLFWRQRPRALFTADHRWKAWNTRYAGKEALAALHSKGYRWGGINGAHYLAHRVVFKMIHGTEPEEIDHDDHDRSNNREKNLLSGSHSVNLRNAKRYGHNTSGIPGVYWVKARRQWAAGIRVNNRMIHLGRFTQKDQAAAARKTAETKYGFHKNHGRSA